jgi:hypothetical protein
MSINVGSRLRKRNVIHLLEPVLAPFAGARRLARHFNPADECGSALVEYAVGILLLLTIMFGIIDFARALYAYHFVSDAAREGTRQAIVRGSTCSGLPGPCPVTSGSDIQSLLAIPSGINPRAVTVNATWPGGGTNCPGPVNAPGCVVEVQVTYNFSFILPFMPTSGIQLQSTSEMVISQ